jgi:hypothetical protein
MKKADFSNRQKLPANYGEGGFLSLISLLLTLVIICILAVYFLRGPGGFGGATGGAGAGASGAGGGVGGAIGAMNKAKEATCRNNLQQLRAAIQIFVSNGEGNPESLEQLTATSPGLQLKCPVGGEPYEYDPQTGTVKCVHPGHEKL